jgi:hypothetical protein
VSKLETPLTRAYWQALGEGTLYEEFRVADRIPGVQSWRDADGVVILGQKHRIASRHERAGVSLDDRDVIVIQTKATRLNPYVFGQALLSMDLIRMRWAPRSLRSVLICADDDPDLRPVVTAFPKVKVRVDPSEGCTRFGLSRLPGAAADLARQRGLVLFDKPRLTPSFRIDGVVIPSCDSRPPLPLAELVSGKRVTTVHSQASQGRAATLGMWMSGEVIAAQHLLVRMGAAAVHSIVLCGRDQAIEEALRLHASFEIVEPGAFTGIHRTARRLANLGPSITRAEDRQASRSAAELDGQQRRSGKARAADAQEFIPGHFCRLCGWPFTASQRQPQCQAPAACQRRQKLPLHLRGYGCRYNDRVHPEWRDLHS